MIDEHLNFTRSATKQLKDESYSIQTVMDASSAKEAIIGQSCDIFAVVCTYKSDHIKGLDIIKMITSEGLDIPVILVSDDFDHSLIGRDQKRAFGVLPSNSIDQKLNSLIHDAYEIGSFFAKQNSL